MSTRGWGAADVGWCLAGALGAFLSSLASPLRSRTQDTDPVLIWMLGGGWGYYLAGYERLVCGFKGRLGRSCMFEGVGRVGATRVITT